MITSLDCTTIEKDIVYNRKNRDYDCFLIIDGTHNLIGCAATYHDGEVLCNDAYYQVLEDTQAREDPQGSPDAAADQDETATDLLLDVAQVIDAHLAIDETSADDDLPVTEIVHDADWTEYTCGHAALHVEYFRGIHSISLGIEHHALIEWRLPDQVPTVTFQHLETLLQHPVVRARVGLGTTSPVTVSRWHNEYGMATATRYTCGDAKLVLDDAGGASLVACGTDIPLDQLDGVHNLVRLLHDPQVRTALQRKVA